jgi:hypothetical protein
MDNRTKTLFSFTLLAAAISTIGCGVSQPSRFQTSFLPPAPKSAELAIDLEPPPIAQSNLYLKDLPAVFISAPLEAPLRRMRGD